MKNSRKFPPQWLDGYTIVLLATVALATVLPVHGRGYELAGTVSKLVVALLFFLHGVKLSPQNLWLGLTHWRLHLVIISSTFVMFPILGLLLKPLMTPVIGVDLYLGMMFICILPSTVQSSIAFTSLAGGNVAAAVCAASFSSLLGIFVTPLLAGLLMNTAGGGISSQAVIDLCRQLLLPFALGQVMRRRLAPLIGRHKALVTFVDRLSIVFIVYVAFSHGANSGLWGQLSLPLFLLLGLVCGILLALALVLTGWVGRLTGFNRADRIVILFCGSKKSLATGVPMANIIFPPGLASVIILPLMVFHQMQLMACALIARRLAAETGAGAENALPEKHTNCF
ncbi:MAG: bile acid:sodium symporter [Candidatus Adiutrix sp.]|jgi:sodium/bile acid cotransporter 7|nr:bile acid:sodium symporter [Candidatus Adiutrix sp.]